VVTFFREGRAEGYMERIETLQRLSTSHGRNNRRFELEFPARLKFVIGSSSSEIEAVSKNVSLGGLLLRSALPVPQHIPVTFVLSIHGKESIRPIHLMGEGEIVRVEINEADRAFMIAVRCKTPLSQLEEYLPVH
jgi:PilZ domain-containing protein